MLKKKYTPDICAVSKTPESPSSIIIYRDENALQRKGLKMRKKCL